jgi:hypothetical protein
MDREQERDPAPAPRRHVERYLLDAPDVLGDGPARKRAGVGVMDDEVGDPVRDVQDTMMPNAILNAARERASSPNQRSGRDSGTPSARM